MEKITKQEAAKKIMQEQQKIFSVQFVKKDGSVRDMICRRGVSKGVTGAGMSYNPKDYQLVTVFDMRKNEFRSIPLDRLRKLKIDGIECEVI